MSIRYRDVWTERPVGRVLAQHVPAPSRAVRRAGRPAVHAGPPGDRREAQHAPSHPRGLRARQQE